MTANAQLIDTKGRPLTSVGADEVRLSDGTVIKKIDRVFLLSPNKENGKILHTVDGVVYERQKNGSLKRLTPKKMKHKMGAK